MATLPTNRTTANTRDEHVADHNEAHGGHNLNETHRGSTTAAHGGLVAATDARLTDARTPTAHKATHEPGGTDALAVDAAAATGSLRTLGTGATQALPGNHASTTDARTPLAHRSTHGLGGSDVLTAADLGGGTANASTFLRGDRTWAALPTTVDATTITTAAHTAAAADAGKVIRMTFVGASTLTIPANATTAFAIGTIINAYAAGGALTIAAAAGVTIRNNAAALAQYGECSLRKDGTDEWVRVG